MAILYLEGFDNLDSTGANLRLLGGATYDARAGRRNGGAIAIANTDDATFPAATGGTTILFGAAVKPSFETWIDFRFVNSTPASMISVRIQSTGVIDVYRGNPTTNLLGSTTGPVWTTSSFKYIEIKTVSNASTGSVEIHVDEEVVLNLTNVNTAGATGNFAGVFCETNNGGQLHYIDDVYITDGADGFWGDTQILSVLPKANGANTGWTASGSGWSDINDIVPAGLGNITSSTANQKSTFDVGSVSDLARSADVTTVTGDSGANIIDYDENNFWTAGAGAERWITVDLGSSKFVSHYLVDQDTSLNFARSYEFKFQSSTDNATWTDHATYANTVGNSGIVAFGVTARYFRAITTGTVGGNGWRFKNMRLYAVEDISTAKTIKAVQMTLDMHPTTGSATIQPIVRISGTDYAMGTPMNVASGVQGPGKGLATVSPATSAAFTATEINGAEFGVRFEG